MSLLIILFAVLVVAVGATLTGAQPDGTKPASKTRLMTAARVVLAVMAAFALLTVLRGYFGA